MISWPIEGKRRVYLYFLRKNRFRRASNVFPSMSMSVYCLMASRIVMRLRESVKSRTVSPYKTLKSRNGFGQGGRISSLRTSCHGNLHKLDRVPEGCIQDYACRKFLRSKNPSYFKHFFKTTYDQSFQMKFERNAKV